MSAIRFLFIIGISFIVTQVTAQQKTADLFVYNARIYTVDASFSKTEAMVVANGKIIATGKTALLRKTYKCKEEYNANGKFIYPGFIDAHAHFLNYGLGLRTVDLTGAVSWEECLQRIDAFIKKNKLPAGSWVTGRGWDQNDWPVKEFPTRAELDNRFKNYYILLSRVDGHAAIASGNVLTKAGIKAGQTMTGGDFEVKNGQLTGILIDNAIDMAERVVPGPTTEQTRDALLQAQANCFAMGLTTIDDCGLSFLQLNLLKKMQEEGKLKMRLYVMLSDAPGNYAYIKSNNKLKTDRLHVNGFKVYADGALGSRGACLLEPYSDKAHHHGFLLSKPEHFDSVARFLYENNLQMCTHAIGDSGNRTILKIYAKYLQGKNDRRWRIEHAQVVNKSDFNWFGSYSIVPSVQPTHATSDMYWAGDRLGAERVKGAYAYKQLLAENGWIPLGTDFPVEDISPFKTFRASVIRKDEKGWPASGYQMENALTRQETIRGMTIWAAKSNFEEQEKGSLEAGKFADFVVLDTDLMTCRPEQITKTKVLATFLNGEAVYRVR
jgi:predicted amidohydrolase YtcJ